MKRKTLLLALLALLLVMVSCTHTETIYVQPEPIDLTPSMQVLFDTRPRDEDIKIIEDVKTLDDIIDNSAAYLMAWELWETYALSLEDYIKYIGDRIGSPKV